MITLTLPYPLSANRYWRTTVLHGHVSTYVSPEAKDYRKQVARIASAAGISEPLAGRVAISVQLYPPRPIDFAKRMKRDPMGWDDTVRCLDLDNANKVLLDALKGVAIEDDKWVRMLSSERMEPDAEPARVVVRIARLVVPQPQSDLLETAA